MQVTVVGAGVVGLSIAVRLLERGHDVVVTATDAGAATTSSVAAALWYPYLAAPAEQTRRWGARTYARLSDIAQRTPEAGVDVRWGTHVRQQPTGLPAWHADVDAFETGADGSWRFRVPVADMGVYLPWLQQEVGRLGGQLRLGTTTTAQTIRALPQAADAVTVLATGLGARQILDDATVTPVRGQVVLLERGGIKEWTLDDTGDATHPTYVVPRRDVVVCGGTALPGRWDLIPDARTTADVLSRCRTLVPELQSAQVLDVRVGLRPVRPAVRLERVAMPDLQTPLIACYGHGGAGVTLSWGCADDVAEMVDRL